jgi:alanyl-tRNA synthetase
VIDTFGTAYPELRNELDTITETIIDEENSFSTMLQRGIKYFNEIEQDNNNEKKIITGEQAFFLYDTLGFPIDLTEIMANEANIQIDMNGFYNAMNEQKVRSRQAQKLSKLTITSSSDNNDDIVNDSNIDLDYINRVLVNMELIAEQTVSLSNSGILPTDDSFKHEHDVPNGLPATVLAIFSMNEKDYQFVSHDDIIDSYQPIGLVLDKSSFYSEGGGQVSDIGTIDIIDHKNNKKIGTFQVNDVQVYGGYVLHKGYVINDGNIKVGQIVNCQVNYMRRQYITPNHSMTHVLNSALRSILGTKIDQRGSLCNTDKLRFDFSYKQAMTITEIQQVEDICQDVVKQKYDVISVYIPLNDAMKIEGVRAVFGEVYPDPVRVVTIGTDTSIEFCGGTHIQNTADAEAFVIIEETAVAKGIRPITAVTKDIAKQAIQDGISLEEKVSSYELLPIDTTPNLNKLTIQLRKELESKTLSAVLKMELRIRIEQLQKKINDYNKKLLQKRIDTCINDMKDIILTKVSNNEQVLVLQVDIGIDTKASQTIINTMKSLAPDMAFLGISIEDDDADEPDKNTTNDNDDEGNNNKKVFVFAHVPDSILNSKSLKANEWIQTVLLLCSNGRGGGKPNNAQGQGMIDNNNNSMIQTMLHDAEQYAQTQL